MRGKQETPDRGGDQGLGAGDPEAHTRLEPTAKSLEFKSRGNTLPSVQKRRYVRSN